MVINYREALDYEANSPHQHLSECVRNSMENIHTNVMVERVNILKKMHNLSQGKKKSTQCDALA